MEEGDLTVADAATGPLVDQPQPVLPAPLEQCRARGLRLIDEQPRRGIRNSLVAFLHPASTGGVLTELVQPAEDH